MNCFVDYIGIKWCNAPEPESGLYLNELPGFSLKSIDQLANEEQVSFLAVWKAVQKRAIAQLLSAFKSELARQYKISHRQVNYSLQPQIETVLYQTPAANEWRGVLLSLQEDSSSALVLQVKQLSVFLKTAATTTVKLVDVTNGIRELGSYSLNGNSGTNAIALSVDLAGVRRLLILYDATSVESVYSGITETTTHRNVVATQGVISDTSFNTLTTGNNTFGICLDARVLCGYEALACNHKRALATSLWYLVGAELMLERLQSDRLNRYTTIDAAKARELREEYLLAFKNELKPAIAEMPLMLNDDCLSCNALLQSVINLP